MHSQNRFFNLKLYQNIQCWSPGCSMALVQPLAFISTLATPTGSLERLGGLFHRRLWWSTERWFFQRPTVSKTKAISERPEKRPEHEKYKEDEGWCPEIYSKRAALDDGKDGHQIFTAGGYSYERRAQETGRVAEGERAQHQHSVVKTTADGREIKIMGPSCLGPLLPFLVLSYPALCIYAHVA